MSSFNIVNRYPMTILLCLGISAVHAQENANFRLNGSARQLDRVCYELTPDELWQSGTMWNERQVNLNESFTLFVDIFLGCTDDNGADGITFALQPLSVTSGSDGEGIGLDGIEPSLGVEFDTWQNFNLFDPGYDHIAIVRNGNLNHLTNNTLAGPERMIPNVDNVEDCAFHTLKIIWDADRQRLQVFFDCILRLEYSGDIVNSIFRGDPNVFWGFTSATGGSSNLHQVCFVYSSFLDELEPAIICSGDSIQSPLFTNSRLTYEWTPSIELTNPDSANALFYPGSDRIYQVAITDPCDEIFMDEFPISIQTPTIEGVEVISFDCDEQIAQITISSSENVEGWQYRFNDNNFQDSNLLDQVPAGTVRIEVMDSSGCTDSLEFLVSAVEGPQIQSIETSPATCLPNGQIEITNVMGEGPFTFSLDSLHNTSGLFTGLSAGIYVLGITDQNNCTTFDSVQLLLDSLSLVGVNVNGSDCNEPSGSVTLLVEGGQTPYTYVLNEGVAQSGNEFNRVAPGVFQFQILDNSGCEIRGTGLIESACNVYVPNVFSPNQDGINDTWQIITSPWVNSVDEVYVYNRFGDLVYYDSPISNAVSTGWDGSYQGQALNPDVFTYFIKGSLQNGESFTNSGSVTLVR